MGSHKGMTASRVFTYECSWMGILDVVAVCKNSKHC
jgi:hypothetical protein